MNKLYIDMDGVLFNTIKEVVALYNHDYYDDLDYRDVKSWSFSEITSRGKISKNRLFKYFTDYRFFRDVELMENADAILNWLYKEHNVKMVIVTAGNSQNLQLKQEWLKRHHQVWSDNIEFIGVNGFKKQDKSMVDMSDGMFLDDNDKNLRISNAKYPVCYGNIFHYNKNTTYPRCRNWQEVGKLIHSLINR